MVVNSIEFFSFLTRADLSNSIVKSWFLLENVNDIYIGSNLRVFKKMSSHWCEHWIVAERVPESRVSGSWNQPIMCLGQVEQGFFFIFCGQIFGIGLFDKFRSALWKIIKYGKQLAKKWRNALFNLACLNPISPYYCGYPKPRVLSTCSATNIDCHFLFVNILYFTIYFYFSPHSCDPKVWLLCQSSPCYKRQWCFDEVWHSQLCHRLCLCS